MMGLARRMLLAALAEIGKAKREARHDWRDRSLSEEDRTKAMSRELARALGRDEDEVHAEIVAHMNGEGSSVLETIERAGGSVIRFSADGTTVNGKPASPWVEMAIPASVLEQDDGTPEGRRALFAEVFRRERERLGKVN